jgi:cytoskeletal protein CcmA (bactofilin family)
MRAGIQSGGAIRTSGSWAEVDHTPQASAKSAPWRPAGTSSNRRAVHDVTALLGPGTRFEGRLAFEGNIRVEGAIIGDVRGDGALILAHDGSIVGDVLVRMFIMRGGEIRGNVTAETIEIYPPARVRGDLQAPALSIEKGVDFEGRCRMTASTAVAELTARADALGAPTEPAEEGDCDSTSDPPVDNATFGDTDLNPDGAP